MKRNTLTLNNPVEHEHELYRTVIEFCLGVEQGHSRMVLLGKSKFLRRMAVKYIGAGTFKDADHV